MFQAIISASILSADFGYLAEQLQLCEQAGVDWIHIDVMDGAFVPNITMGPFIVETCRRLTSLPLDVHLMIEKPEKHIESFAKAGANYLTIHIEEAPNVHRTLQAIKQMGVKAGIAVNPGTPADHIEGVADLIDLILVMTVNPGFSGQQFIHSTVNKISVVKGLLRGTNSNAIIQVDGGITTATMPIVFKAGARSFVAATAIFKHPQGVVEGVKALRDSIP
jgi:ribulose-phosphate 3-epimerase